MRKTTTVKAKDSTSAMEKIVSEIGEDSVILSTKHVDGMVEMTASNSLQHKNAVKKRFDKNKFSKIYKDKKKSLTQIGKNKENLNIHNFIPKASNENKNIFDFKKTDLSKEFDKLAKHIDNRLEGLLITEDTAMINKLAPSNSIRLKQLGFSTHIVTQLRNTFCNHTFEEGRVKFIRALAKLLTAPFPERMFKAKVILVTGTSGTGKTTLAAKIASSISDKTGKNNIVLAELCRKNHIASEDLRSFARLLNIPLTNQLKHGDISDTMLLNDEAKIVVDLAGDLKSGNKIIDGLESRHGDTDICTVLCLPSGSSNNLMKKTWQLVKAQRPIVALTKLDECEISAAGLSTLAELSARIGIVSGNKSIVDSLLFTNEDVLTKFMKENF